MRIAIPLAVISMLAATPAFASADHFNALNRETLSTGINDMGWLYGSGSEERNAAKVLAKLRTLCSSDNHYDQYYCARGMKVLNKAYAEFKLRKAAEAAIAD